MKIYFRTRAWLIPVASATLMALSGGVSAQSYEASLERGAQPDTTAQQRYQTAIREAGGGLKLALTNCRQQGAERRACESEARQNYKADMAYARHLRTDPDARPARVRGGEIRSTEITTFREIPAKR